MLESIKNEMEMIIFISKKLQGICTSSISVRSYIGDSQTNFNDRIGGD